MGKIGARNKIFMLHYTLKLYIPQAFLQTFSAMASAFPALRYVNCHIGGEITKEFSFMQVCAFNLDAKLFMSIEKQCLINCKCGVIIQKRAILKPLTLKV